jgi:hypothetical protein
MNTRFLLTVFLALIAYNRPAQGQDALTDNEAFFVYRDSDSRENHGYWTNYMPDGEAGKKHMAVSLTDKSDPYRGSTCIKVEIKSWHPEGWLGLAVSCKRNYSGDTTFDGAYSLRGMRKLVFYACGNQGGESIQVQALTTGEKPFGDSAKDPVESEWIRLDKTWKRYEIELRSANLERVVIPFAIFVDTQHNEGSSFSFFLDHIHYTVGKE